MEASNHDLIRRFRRWLAKLACCSCLLGTGVSTHAELLLRESFNQPVADFSPVAGAPGWRALALYNGVVTDFSFVTPGDKFPNLSHTASVNGVDGPGYLVLGSGQNVSNVLAWLECRLPLTGCPSSTISFYTKNDLAGATERLVVRVGSQWYATVQTFGDDGGNVEWKLNTFRFSTAAQSWQLLDTNALALGARAAGPLPSAEIEAIGFLGHGAGSGKIRIDELHVRCGSLVMDPTLRVGSWIWSDETKDRQYCRIWKTFELPANSAISKARLRITADNSYDVYLDGEKIGQGAEWRRLTEYDLTLLLRPGSHVLAVQAFNEVGAAGLLAGITVDLDDGRVLEIPSDSSWRIVPDDQKGWIKKSSPQPSWGSARIVAHLHDYPGFPNRPQVLFPSALQPVMIRFWQRGWFQITMLTTSVIFVVFYFRLLARLALQSKSQEVLQRERARIARDIHDDLGAGLTQLVLLGEAEQREAAAQPEMRAKFESISEAGRRLLRSIDEVVWLVNSQRDSLQDFEAYICRYAENFLRASSVRCRLDVDSEVPPFSFNLAARRSLFLVIKEALNNAVRHSGASEVELTIQVVNDEVRVRIKDNGKGFDPAQGKPERDGLTNMSQRMREIGGRCQITSQPGSGCCVELTAPLRDRERGVRGWWRRWTKSRIAKKHLS
ncbi:MAG TPA: ATP-binding protein [Verrucomicrobiae bacterium]|nr:ATP-binding protein [Verrucomicrobiae bacterium]